MENKKKTLLIVLFIIICVPLIFLAAYFVDTGNISLEFFSQNKLLAFKYTGYNDSIKKFPNFVEENKKEKQEEATIFKLPEPLPNPPKTLSVPILMYHNIATLPSNANSLQKGLTVMPNDFEQQLVYLKSKGYEAISMTDLFRVLYRDGKLPLKPIILTFDDGYDNAYSGAFFFLKKYNYTGTFFVISDEIDKPTRLSAKQIKEMSDAGMEMESHSKTHSDLRGLSLEAISAELHDSRAVIEQITGKRVFYFCYPSGQYKPEVINILREQGYLLAVTTKRGTSEDSNYPFELPRLRIWGGISFNDFKGQLP